jgi:MFS family permease
LEVQIARKDPYAALKIKEFRCFISARFLITFALQIQNVVVAWKVYEITQDVFSLGLIGLAEAIPSLLIALYAGYVIDRNDRKLISALAVSLLILCSIGLLFATQMEGINSILFIYGLIFLSGFARGFMGPSFFSLLGQLVPKSLYKNASTWSSSSWQIAAVIGPAFGGFSYTILGIKQSMLIVISTLLAGLLFVTLIKRKERPERTDEGIIESLLTGIRFVFRNKIILGALSLDLFAVLFGGAVALLPAFANDVLHIGAEGLGLLKAAPSIGAVITMILMAHRPLENAGKKLLFCVGGFGICMIMFALSGNFYFSLLILVLSGAFDSVSVVIRGTILQLYTPENMRGRVSAVNSIFIGSSNELGAFESGLTARLMGLIPSVLFGGIATISIVLFTSAKAKELKTLQLEG